MQRRMIGFGGIVILSIAVYAIGCRKSETPNAKPQGSAESKQTSTVSTEQSGKEAEITTALAELPADDRKLAVEQKICPVSGERLGSMGAPVKIDVKGQPVFICCEGCRDELLSKPEEFLA